MWVVLFWQACWSWTGALGAWDAGLWAGAAPDMRPGLCCDTLLILLAPFIPKWKVSQKVWLRIYVMILHIGQTKFLPSLWRWKGGKGPTLWHSPAPPILGSQSVPAAPGELPFPSLLFGLFLCCSEAVHSSLHCLLGVFSLHVGVYFSVLLGGAKFKGPLMLLPSRTSSENVQLSNFLSLNL